ncbi:MAG: pyruvate synthase subunit beta [Deltaproteobacteria bacterium]|nr:pyruvate synthase subunit beta [Deltaproteobacteria bacterium]
MLRWVTKALGSDSICNLAATCLALPTMVYPHSLEVPCLYISMAPSPAGITGTGAALKVLKRKGRFPADRKINVFALAGDGSAGDIGLASLSGAAERNDDGIYFVFDNEAYMNTGIQRSGSTPQHCWTTSTLQGKPERKKDLPRIMAAHDIPYVATVSFAYPEDFMAKVEKARDMEPGFKYIQAHSPCPTGWRFPENKTIEVARMAVETGLWVLYEIDHGQFKISYRPSKFRPVQDYLGLQGRFKDLSQDDIRSLQNVVDQKWKDV